MYGASRSDLYRGMSSAEPIGVVLLLCIDSIMPINQHPSAACFVCSQSKYTAS